MEGRIRIRNALLDILNLLHSFTRREKLLRKETCHYGLVGLYSLLMCGEDQTVVCFQCDSFRLNREQYVEMMME